MNQYTFEDIYIGQTCGFEVVITAEMVSQFRLITGDDNPLHCDREFAESQGYKDRVVYGMLTTSFYSTLAGMYMPGKHSLIHNVEVNLVNPVFIGDKLRIEGSVMNKNDLYRFINIKVSIKNQDGVKVARGKLEVGLLR